MAPMRGFVHTGYTTVRGFDVVRATWPSGFGSGIALFASGNTSQVKVAKIHVWQLISADWFVRHACCYLFLTSHSNDIK